MEPPTSPRAAPLVASVKVHPRPRSHRDLNSNAKRFIDYDRPHLVDVATRFKTEVHVDKHCENLKTYPDTFYGTMNADAWRATHINGIGVEAINWLVSSEGISREAAVHVRALSNDRISHSSC